VAVLALMALILGLALPALQRSYQQEQDQAVLRQLAGACRLARSLAATQRRRVRLFLDLRTRSYRVEGVAQEGELTGMNLSEAHLVWLDPEKRRGYIAFYGDGSSTGGLLTLQDRRGRRHVLEVEIITGKVSFKAG
jgi:type II secretory pathway pseudopilin PulG